MKHRGKYQFTENMNRQSISSMMTNDCSVLKLIILSLSWFAFGITVGFFMIAIIDFAPTNNCVKNGSATVYSSFTNAEFLKFVEYNNFSTICFDYDDTLAFTTPAFQYAKRFDTSIWTVVNDIDIGIRFTNFKNSTMDLLVELVKRNVSIVIITARCAENQLLLRYAVDSLKYQIQRDFTKRQKVEQLLSELYDQPAHVEKRSIDDTTSVSSVTKANVVAATGLLPSIINETTAENIEFTTSSENQSMPNIELTSAKNIEFTTEKIVSTTAEDESFSTKQLIEDTDFSIEDYESIHSLDQIISRLNSMKVEFSCPELDGPSKREAIEKYKCDAMFGDSDQDIHSCIISNYECTPVRVLRSPKSSYRRHYHPHRLYKEAILINSMD